MEKINDGRFSKVNIIANKYQNGMLVIVFFFVYDDV